MMPKEELLELDQAEQIQQVKETFSSPGAVIRYSIQLWQGRSMGCNCYTDDLQAMNDKLLGWDGSRLTYVDTSVAIDPARGTAKNKLLYKADVVPPGVNLSSTWWRKIYLMTSWGSCSWHWKALTRRFTRSRWAHAEDGAMAGWNSRWGQFIGSNVMA